jgi:hypothetical protein
VVLLLVALVVLVLLLVVLPSDGEWEKYPNMWKKTNI